MLLLLVSSNLLTQLYLYIKGTEENLTVCPLYTGSNNMHGEHETVLYGQ